MNSLSAVFKSLPSVDKVLQSVTLAVVIERVGHEGVKLETRLQLEQLRQKITQQDEDSLNWLSSPDFFEDLCRKVKSKVEAEFSGSLIPVFNLTGTVVHTNLGRACLPSAAVNAMTIAATQATNLEFDLATGKRGDRDSHLEESLCALTGAEAATVVNNNAAAVLLMLNTFSSHKEVLISRGELVEIGGAFRIPDVMKSANCILKEVGTTNRTHLRDYESAINSETGLIMKVHTSNYEIRGFTNSVTESDLSQLAQEKGIPFVSDLGSGTLVDLKQFNLPYEPTVRQTIEAGVDVVSFSGDKLLGGPQAGIVVGKKELIQRIKSNPLKRALRVDKITLAALSEVINLYKDPQRLTVRLPLLADLTRPLSAIEAVAVSVLPLVRNSLADKAVVESGACKSQIGSGALPLDLLESHALIITPIAEKGHTDVALNRLAASFRSLPKPVIGRISDGKLIFDLRCLRDVDGFIEQLSSLLL